jgi:hypothetical protein
MKLSNNPELRRLQKIAVHGLLYGSNPVSWKRAEAIAEAIEMKFNHMQRIRGILPLDEVELDIARQMDMTPDAYRLWLMDILLEPPANVVLTKEFGAPFTVSREMIDDETNPLYGTKDDLIAAARRFGLEVDRRFSEKRLREMIAEEQKTDDGHVREMYDTSPVDLLSVEQRTINELLQDRLDETQRAANRQSTNETVRKLQRMADFHRNELKSEGSALMLESATVFPEAPKQYTYPKPDNMEIPTVGGFLGRRDFFGGDAGLKRSTSRPRLAGLMQAAGVNRPEDLVGKRVVVELGQEHAEKIRQQMNTSGTETGRIPAPPSPANYYNMSENDINALFERVESNRAWMESCTKTARHSDPHDAAHLEVMRELSRASKQYINSCRTLIEACDFNAQRPMMAQGAANAPG